MNSVVFFPCKRIKSLEYRTFATQFIFLPLGTFTLRNNSSNLRTLRRLPLSTFESRVKVPSGKKNAAYTLAARYFNAYGSIFTRFLTLFIHI